MPTKHVSFGSEFGVALHEQGLNRVSGALRAARPELFAYNTKIPIADGHELTLYAVVDAPIAFNLYPVAATPAVPEDGAFVSVNILFSLTDSVLGTITRMRIIVEAGVQVIRRKDGLVIGLLKKATSEPWFDIVKLEGEHPADVSIIRGAVDAGAEVVTKLTAPDGDEATARTFRAIMNYLITLFLKEGLTRTLTEFPLPNLGGLVEAGPLGKLDGRDVFIRNDALYLTLGRANGGDGGFPTPFGGADLAVGVSEAGLKRVLDAFLPAPIDLPSSDTATITMRSSDFRISRIQPDLRPGEDKFTARIFFGGTIDLRLQFKVFGRWVHTPWLPLPIDASLSHYGGKILPFVERLNAGEPNERFELKLRPDQRFFEEWYIFIATNYRDLFRRLFKEAVERVRDQLIHKDFCKIPILGWIVCKTTDLLGEVLGWALGAALDVFMSFHLTLLINTIGRAVLGIMKDEQKFKIVELQQAMIAEAMGLKIASGWVEQVEDARGGELQLGLSFTDGGFPPPPPPTPEPTDPQPAPIPGPDLPDLRELPEYAPGDFEPAWALPRPDWTDGAEEVYAVKVEGTETRATAEMTIRYEAMDDGFRIIKETRQAGGEAARLIGEYAGPERRAKRSDARTVSAAPNTSEFDIAHEVQYADGGVSTVSAQVLGASFDRSIAVRDRRYLDFEELWLFRLAHAPLEELQKGVFARVEVSDPYSIRNWARQVPVKISITATKTFWPPEGTDMVDAFVIRADDEDGTTVATVATGIGVIKATITQPGVEVNIALKA